MNTKRANRIAVIGLDGATFKLLDPLFEKGKMPNLKKFVDRGVRGTLLSTKPPVTAPSWTTFATGVNPGKHGCYDFFLPGETFDSFRPANSSEIKVPTIYEMLHDNNKRAVLINLPNSFPPKVPEFPTITSLMTVGDDFIFPANLKDKYPELNHYPLSPDENIKLSEDMDTYIKHIVDIDRKRVAAVKKMFLQESWDLFFFLFSSTDWVSHLVFYDMVENQHPEAMKVFDVVDEFFGWLHENLPADCNLYVMSDHGFTYYTELFYINRWLEQEGYLATTTGSGKLEENATVRRKKLSAARDSKQIRLKVNKRLFKAIFFNAKLEVLAKKFFRKVVKRIIPIHVDINIGLDMANTKVCFPRGSMLQTLYLNFKGNFADGIITDKSEYNHIRSDVKNKLEKLKSPSGKPVTEHVYTKEELYGDTPPIPSPDLHCKTKDVWIVGHLHSKSLFEDHISNKHDEYGIFFAAGPDIKEGVSIKGAEMADLCPTILHHFSLPIPDYTDGKVLDIFKADSPPAQNKPRIEKISKSEKHQLASLIEDIDI